MSKVDDLRNLYKELELNTSVERELLARVKSREATDEEVNDLLDKITSYPNGGKKLDYIKGFENGLVSHMNGYIADLKKMESESIDVAHLEDEEKIDKAYAAMKVRYKEIVEKAEETYDALKEAYFQVDNFEQYNDRLWDAKQKLLHLE